MRFGKCLDRQQPFGSIQRVLEEWRERAGCRTVKGSCLAGAKVGPSRASEDLQDGPCSPQNVRSFAASCFPGQRNFGV